MTGYELRQPAKDKTLGDRLMESSQQLPRFGYRRTALWLDVSLCRVRRLWKQLGVQLPRRRPWRRRCGTDIPLPGAMHPNSVWCYDFVHDRFADARAFRMLCVLDGHTRECLAIEVARSITSQDVILVLSRLISGSLPPDAPARQACRVGTAFVPPGRSWRNGFVESFNGKLRDECLNREWFRDLREARVLIEQWRAFYNQRRPHSSLGNRTPVQARQEALRMKPRLTAWFATRNRFRS